MSNPIARNIMRTRGWDCARELAEENHCAYGLCVADGLYYVGLIEELNKLPVVVKFNYAGGTNG